MSASEKYLFIALYIGIIYGLRVKQRLISQDGKRHQNHTRYVPDYCSVGAFMSLGEQ